MSNWIALIVAAAVTSSVLALLLRRAAALPVDHPNERSLHSTPTPRIGGLALVPGAIGGWLAAGGGGADVLVLCGLAVVLFLVSILDDRHNLAVGPRLAVHFAAALAFSLWLAGLSALALILALAVAWLTNLYNFMDGANGLAGGMAAIGFGACGLAIGEPGSASALAFALVGAAVGFLGFNFDPARVFMGDAGSIPLGFLAGGLGGLGIANGLWPAWFPLLVFSPFVVDASVTLLRRMLRGDRFWQAHREHYYQRLVRMGWSHRRLALAEYLLMLAAAASALALLHAPAPIRTTGLAAWGVIYLVLMASIDARWRQREIA